MKPLSSCAMLALLAVAGLAGISGCKPAAHEEEAAATEVAVSVGKLVLADLHARIEVYGTVEPAPAVAGRPGGSVRLSTPLAGVARTVAVVENQWVKAGDLLIQLDDRLAQAAAAKATQAVAFSDQVLARQQKLKDVGGGSDKSLQEALQQRAAAQADLELAQATLAQLRLVAPFDGVVVHLAVQPGQYVDPAAAVLELADPDRLVIAAGIPVSEASAVQLDQPVELIAGDGQPTAVGQVSLVSSQVDARTGTVPVQAAVLKGSGLRAGQLVRVRIVTAEHRGQLAAPLESVVKAEGAEVLYVVTGDKAVQTPVQTGLRDGGLVEIAAAGLKAGDTVVTSGAYGLPKETRIRVAGQPDATERKSIHEQ